MCGGCVTCSRVWKEFLRWRIPDYLMIIIIAIIAAVVGKVVFPHCRQFEWDDPTISHPFSHHEAFPMYSVIIAVILIALVYFAGELLTRWNRPAGKVSMCMHINSWVLAHAFSILLAFAVVNLAKLYAGRLRPDFLARLAQEGITKETAANFTPHQICRATKEGRLSFPSGHSGTIFSGCVPPSMYLLGLFRTLGGGRYWLAMIALLPLVLPIAVAVSRTVDYRHNFDDILAGSLVGVFCAIFAVLMNFTVSDKGEWTIREAPVNDAQPPAAAGEQQQQTAQPRGSNDAHPLASRGDSGYVSADAAVVAVPVAPSRALQGSDNPRARQAAKPSSNPGDVSLKVSDPEYPDEGSSGGGATGRSRNDSSVQPFYGHTN